MTGPAPGPKNSRPGPSRARPRHARRRGRRPKDQVREPFPQFRVAGRHVHPVPARFLVETPEEVVRQPPRPFRGAGPPSEVPVPSKHRTAGTAGQPPTRFHVRQPRRVQGPDGPPGRPPRTLGSRTDVVVLLSVLLLVTVPRIHHPDLRVLSCRGQEAGDFNPGPGGRPGLVGSPPGRRPLASGVTINVGPAVGVHVPAPPDEQADG